MTNPNTKALSEAGVSIWLDDLSRERLNGGDLPRLHDEYGVVGVTTNPTIFAAALAHGEAYADQINELVEAGADVDDAIIAVTTEDVRRAADVLAPIAEATDGEDGRVSLEVAPTLANDTERTIEQAVDLWKRVGRQNAMIKIPATEAGIPAITAAIAQGISVNVTLIFSLPRYREVINAFETGLEQAHAAGIDVSTIRSVASFFVSRVDVEYDRRLERIGTDAALALRGRAAIANARLAYQVHLESLDTERWRVLAGYGAHPQRPLWASTGTKNPAYPDTLYVTELVAPNTVNTLPEKTLLALADHGSVHGDTISGTAHDANAVLDAIADLGISYSEVVELLEREGVEKFVASWEELRATVKGQLAEAR